MRINILVRLVAFLAVAIVYSIEVANALPADFCMPYGAPTVAFDPNDHSTRTLNFGNQITQTLGGENNVTGCIYNLRMTFSFKDIERGWTVFNVAIDYNYWTTTWKGRGGMHRGGRL